MHLMKKKILNVQFRHETNVFCPLPADELALLQKGQYFCPLTKYWALF